MKVRFLKEARIDGEVAFEQDSDHNLSDDSAQRWIRRGIAEPLITEEDEALEDILDKVEHGKKVDEDKILDALDAVVESTGEEEPSEGALSDKEDEDLGSEFAEEDKKEEDKPKRNQSRRGR